MSAKLRSSLIVTFTALMFGAAAIPASAQDAGDPPSDVARIAVISGAASTHQPGSQDWQAAAQNYPLAPGSGVWTEARSHAAVDVAGARVHLDASSQLEVTAIDQGQVQLAVPQGAAFVQVYPGASGMNIQINTAHGAAYITQPGQYEIVAGDDQHPSSLSVIEGQAQFTGQNANFALQAGQRGNITPDNQSTVDAAQPDDFVRMVQAAEQPYQQQVAQTAQYVSPQQTGYQDLARYGQWNQDPQYGAVWYPQQVQAGWAPYRYGHWAYVAPWGWTWVDDAAWGFTPFHYGRWVEVRDRWAWVPGARVARPVYAPALVSFFGDIGGVGIDVSVGWVPLAPEEVYVPYYQHGPRYARNVNITNVHNETTIINVVNKKTVINYNTYVNRRGATSVSRDVMAGGHAVAPAWRKHDNRQDQQQWAKAKPEQEVPFQPQGNAKAKQAEGPKLNPKQPQWSQHQDNGQPNAQPSNQAKAAAQPGNNNGNSGKTWNNNPGKPGQDNKSTGNKSNNAKPKNNGPVPYIPPVNGSGQQQSSGKQQQSPAPAATNVPAAPKPNKNANAPQWGSNNKTQDKKHPQQPATIYPTAPTQSQQQMQQHQQEQTSKTQQKAQQQQQQVQQQKVQQQQQAQQLKAQQQQQAQQLKAQQQQQKVQQLQVQQQKAQQQRQQKAQQQPNQNQHNDKAPKNQPQAPQQNCGQQGACQQ